MAVYFFVVLPPCQRRGVLLGQQQLSQNAVGDEHALGGQVPTGVLLLASGADGIMIEVHNNPMHALCDGAQSLTPDQFDAVAKQVLRIREVIGA